MAEQTIVLTPLDEIKERVATEFDLYVEQTWQEYCVQESSLTEEMQTWYWKVIKVGRKYHEVIAWKGIGTTLAEEIEKRKVSILSSQDSIELSGNLHKAKRFVFESALYLWAMGKALGPSTSLYLIKKAYKADALADYHERHGKDHIAESQRRRANLLRRKAAGEDVEVSQRNTGATHKARAIYTEMALSGKTTRAELIAAATAAGIHPGTAAVQYARWRREQKS